MFDMLGGCDINTISAETYSHNFGTPRCDYDINQLVSEDGRLERFIELAKTHRMYMGKN